MIRPLIAAIMLVGGTGGLMEFGPGPKQEPAFKPGDMVEIEQPAIGCFTGKDDLLQAISTDWRKWSLHLMLSCDGIMNKADDTNRPFEIMQVADGVGPYARVYCANWVFDDDDFPVDKTGCTWVAFPLGKAHLSSCKADSALPPGTPDPPTSRLACMGHYRS